MSSLFSGGCCAIAGIKPISPLFKSICLSKIFKSDAQLILELDLNKLIAFLGCGVGVGGLIPCVCLWESKALFH